MDFLFNIGKDFLLFLLFYRKLQEKLQKIIFLLQFIYIRSLLFSNYCQLFTSCFFFLRSLRENLYLYVSFLCFMYIKGNVEMRFFFNILFIFKFATLLLENATHILRIILFRTSKKIQILSVFNLKIAVLIIADGIDDYISSCKKIQLLRANWLTKFVHKRIKRYNLIVSYIELQEKKSLDVIRIRNLICLIFLLIFSKCFSLKINTTFLFCSARFFFFCIYEDETRHVLHKHFKYLYTKAFL